jgi:uncharacterized membrane protein
MVSESAVAQLLQSHRPRDINALHEDALTPGQRVADAVARTMGSWPFIIIQSTLLVAWIALNTALALTHHWDPYPFILLNLALSFQAAYAAPFIMMSQNRQSAKDRLHAEEDYRINCKAEAEVATIHGRLEHLTVEAWDSLLTAQEEQLRLLKELRAAWLLSQEASR